MVCTCGVHVNLNILRVLVGFPRPTGVLLPLVWPRQGSRLRRDSPRALPAGEEGLALRDDNGKDGFDPSNYATAQPPATPQKPGLPGMGLKHDARPLPTEAVESLDAAYLGGRNPKNLKVFQTRSAFSRFQ